MFSDWRHPTGGEPSTHEICPEVKVLWHLEPICKKSVASSGYLEEVMPGHMIRLVLLHSLSEAGMRQTPVRDDALLPFLRHVAKSTRM